MQLPEWIVHYWVEWLFGVVAAVLIGLWRSMVRRIRREQEEQSAIKSGLQALLRAQMVNDYNHYSEKGFAPIYARENFENCWVQYERLGENGVMSDIHNKFRALPTQRGDSHEH